MRQLLFSLLANQGLIVEVSEHIWLPISRTFVLLMCQCQLSGQNNTHEP